MFFRSKNVYGLEHIFTIQHRLQQYQSIDPLLKYNARVGNVQLLFRIIEHEKRYTIEHMLKIVCLYGSIKSVDHMVEIMTRKIGTRSHLNEENPFHKFFSSVMDHFGQRGDIAFYKHYYEKWKCMLRDYAGLKEAAKSGHTPLVEYIIDIYYKHSCGYVTKELSDGIMITGSMDLMRKYGTEESMREDDFMDLYLQGPCTHTNTIVDRNQLSSIYYNHYQILLIILSKKHVNEDLVQYILHEEFLETDYCKELQRYFKVSNFEAMKEVIIERNYSYCIFETIFFYRYINSCILDGREILAKICVLFGSTKYNQTLKEGMISRVIKTSAENYQFHIVYLLQNILNVI